MSRTEDISAVSGVLRAYAEGTRDRDMARLRSLFHPAAVMAGYLGPDLKVGGPEPFFDALTANSVGPDYAWAVQGVEVTGATAAATLVEDHLLGLSFVNRFHLVRLPDGGWQIIAKLFHHD